MDKSTRPQNQTPNQVGTGWALGRVTTPGPGLESIPHRSDIATGNNSNPCLHPLTNTGKCAPRLGDRGFANRISRTSKPENWPRAIVYSFDVAYTKKELFVAEQFIRSEAIKHGRDPDEDVRRWREELQRQAAADAGESPGTSPWVYLVIAYLVFK